MRYPSRNELRVDRVIDLSSIFRITDELAEMGCNTNLPAVRKARALADRERDIRVQAQQLRIDATTAGITDLGADLYAGKITTAELLARAAGLKDATETNGIVSKAFAAAGAQARSEGLTHLAGIGDEWISKVIRPAVDALTTKAAEHVEAIPSDINTPVPGYVTTGQAERDGYTRAAREAFTGLEYVLTDLLKLHGAADALRSAGIIPMPSNRDPEQLRWRHPERLRGRIGDYRTFYIDAVRNGAEPGIYTADELSEASRVVLDSPLPVGHAYIG